MTKEKVSVTIESSILKNVDATIDNVYIRNRSQAIERLIEKSIGKSKIAVILAGGDEEKIKISENEYRFTAKIGSKTLVERQIEKLNESEFNNIFINFY